MATDTLHNTFSAMDDETLVTYLIGGMTKRELLERVEEPPSVVLSALGLDDLFLPPLPNHLFTRDTSAWIYDGVAMNSMRMKARVRETIHYEAIYRWHPQFAAQDFHVWSEGQVNGRATAEGGDMLVLGRGAVLIGMSERTTSQGVERLAQKLFAGGRVTRILALSLPEKRAFMHLDTVMTMVDRGHLHDVRRAGRPAVVHDRAGGRREGAQGHRARCPRRCARPSPPLSVWTPSTSSPPPRT